MSPMAPISAGTEPPGLLLDMLQGASPSLLRSMGCGGLFDGAIDTTLDYTATRTPQAEQEVDYEV